MVGKQREEQDVLWALSCKRCREHMMAREKASGVSLELESTVAFAREPGVLCSQGRMERSPSGCGRMA
jgi:hypothetical protein